MRPSFLRAAAVALMMMFVACAEPAAPSSEGAVPDESALVSIPEASYADGTSDPAAVVIALETKSLEPVCGTTCPKGFHPVEYHAQATCSSGYTVTCAPNSGPEFQTCGTSCPAGYHPEEYSEGAFCWIGFPGIFRDQTRCVANSGTQFLTCGTCPGGYHASEYNRVSSCSLDGISTPDNQTQCDVNAGASFYVCGSACPSGYVATVYDYKSWCGSGSIFVNNRVQCQRLVNGDVTVSPQFVTVPSGQSVNVTVSWSTTQATSAELRVTAPGQAESVLSTGLSGSLPYPVHGGETHTFRLFGNGQLLDTDAVVAAIAPTGTISASPQTVVVSSGSTGTTTIAWSSQNAGSTAKVYVRVNGGGPVLVAAGASGTVAAPWIAAGSSYRFSLHAGDSNAAELAAVVVTGQAAPTPTGTITASPQTVVVSGSTGTGTTTIAWSSQNVGSTAKVYVRVNGGAPVLVAAGASGTVAATWIVAGSSCRFSLHAGDSNAAELAAVVVTGTAAVAIVPRPGMWWNPARSGNGMDLRPYGDSLVFYWLTYNLDGSPVWYLSTLGRNGAGYTGNVDRYTWNGGSAAPSVVGTATITMTTPTTGSLAYTVDGRTGAEPIEYYGFAGAPTVPSLSGLWNRPTESGWGIAFDTQSNIHITFVMVYTAAGQPTWTSGSAVGGATVVPFNLIRTIGTNLCPGCTGPTSKTTETVGTMTVDTAQLGVLRLQIDLNWSVWPRWGVVLHRLL